VYESGLEAEKGLRDYFEKTKGAFNAESDFILVEMYMEEE
jgi:hypothetical protein